MNIFIGNLHIYGFNKNEIEGIDAPFAVNGILYQIYINFE